MTLPPAPPTPVVTATMPLSNTRSARFRSQIEIFTCAEVCVDVLAAENRHHDVAAGATDSGGHGDDAALQYPLCPLPFLRRHFCAQRHAGDETPDLHERRSPTNQNR